MRYVNQVLSASLVLLKSPCCPQIHHIFSVHDGEEVDWTIASPQVSEKVKHVEYAARDATEGRTYALSRWFCNRCSWPHSRVTYGYLDLSAHCRTEYVFASHLMDLDD